MPEKSNLKLNPTDFHLAESHHHRWAVMVEQGITKENLSDPSFWSHVSIKLRPWNHIEVYAKDGTFYAEYLVLACDRTWAKVRQLVYLSLTDTDMSQTEAEIITEGYDCKFRGPRKWSVIRIADNAVLQENMHTQDEAKLWLKGHLNIKKVPA